MNEQTPNRRADCGEGERAARPDTRPELRPAPAAPAADIWRVADVAAYLQVSPQAVYKMTAAKATVRIPHLKIGNKLRFRRADIERWVALLTVSNLDVLSRMRRQASKVNHGNDT